MGVSVYVFVECEHKETFRAKESIEKIAGVKTADAVTGQYDIIALVRASNIKVLGDVVIKKIQGIPGIKRTITNVIIE